tara:strand:+ start:3699 stop:4643 length:945 start_codon:yes stop_codon:yes gene_type:complete
MPNSNNQNLITGGAGFIGSNLINHLIKKGEKVICIDNFFSGRELNISKWLNHPRFQIINHDITIPIEIHAEKIWHLASPASPSLFYKYPIETSKTNYLGTLNMLELARKNNARILLASSSSIYGEAEVHPQIESYKGLVNSFGNRSCYEEGKRIAESLFFDYQKIHNCDIRIARIFNTYGPNMNPKDGRVISNFIVQAIKNEPITVFGTGQQTRSFCFVDDLIQGLISLMNSNYKKPINLGNEHELKVIKLAKLISLKVKSNSKIINLNLPADDPIKRRPSITLAQKKLNWQPNIDLEEGLNKTIYYFKKELNN